MNRLSGPRSFAAPAPPPLSGGKDWPPSPDGTAAAFEVEDFAGCVATLRAAGVKFIFEPSETPVCRMVVVSDPDGNRVVLHQRKPR